MQKKIFKNNIDDFDTLFRKVANNYFITTDKLLIDLTRSEVPGCAPVEKHFRWWILTQVAGLYSELWDNPSIVENNKSLIQAGA